MKVKIIRHGITHYYAQCHECEFDAGILTKATPSEQDVRNAVNRHVRTTGHKVVIEMGRSTEYQPKQ